MSIATTLSSPVSSRSVVENIMYPNCGVEVNSSTCKRQAGQQCCAATKRGRDGVGQIRPYWWICLSKWHISPGTLERSESGGGG